MTAPQDNLVLFPSSVKLGQRRNKVIFHLDAYLRADASESQQLERIAEELLGIANGQLKDVEENFEDLRICQMDEGDYQQDTLTEPRSENPGAILTDAIVAGIVWRNPTSPSTKKMVDILSSLKSMGGSPFTEDMRNYVEDTYGRCFGLVRQCVTKSLQKDAEHKDDFHVGLEVKQDMKFVHNLFMARLYAGSVVDTIDHSTLQIITDELFFNSIMDLEETHPEMRPALIEIYASCIDRDLSQDEPIFLRTMYENCENSSKNPKEIWSRYQEALGQLTDNVVDKNGEDALEKIAKAMQGYIITLVE